MALRDRLRRLEKGSAGKRCPECELLPEGPGYIVHDETRASSASKEREQEYCPRCGRPLYFIITVAYES